MVDDKKIVLSVIVPVYKTQDYLERCVKSLLASTYKNLEILLIDDGSPDNCPVMCDEYARNDERIVVYHKENGGVHTAKNYGLDVATGEFVTFCDSDDCVPVDAYEKLMKRALESEADVVLGNVRRTIIDTGDVRVSHKSKDNLANMLGGHTANIYKRKFLDGHNIRIGEMKMGEGLCFMVQVLNLTDKIEYIDEVTYDYYIRPSVAQNASAMQMQYKKFELYYDDFVWRKWVINYVTNSLKLKKRFGNQLGDFCKIIDENWLAFSCEEREKCFHILKETVQLIDWREQNAKGFLKVEQERFLKMTEKKYSKYLKNRYKYIEPLKKILKR